MRPQRKRNLVKHDLAFADVTTVFDGMTFSVEDERDYEDGPRYPTLGLLRGIVIFVVHTLVSPDTVHIISARKATRYERRADFQQGRK